MVFTVDEAKLMAKCQEKGVGPSSASALKNYARKMVELVNSSKKHKTAATLIKDFDFFCKIRTQRGHGEANAKGFGTAAINLFRALKGLEKFTAKGTAAAKPTKKASVKATSKAKTTKGKKKKAGSTMDEDEPAEGKKFKYVWAKRRKKNVRTVAKRRGLLLSDTRALRKEELKGVAKEKALRMSKGDRGDLKAETVQANKRMDVD